MKFELNYNKARGKQLDGFAALYGLARKRRWFFFLESDESLRSRIREVIAEIYCK